MSCQARTTLLNSSANLSDLENQLCIASQDVQSVFANTQPHNKKEAQLLREGACGPPSYRMLSAETRILELDVAEIAINYPGMPMGVRGLHDTNSGKIILCQSNWCRETLIHETLHKFSFTAVRPDIGRRYINFFEGLTEFFTGYTLYKKYTQCYQAWKSEVYRECRVTYIPFVKLWAAFCRFIPLHNLVPVYFWDGTNDWETKCSGLIQAVHKAGYNNFGDFRIHPTPTIEGKILDESMRNFGRVQFRKYI